MRLRLAGASDDRAIELLAAIGQDAAAGGVAVVRDGGGGEATVVEPGDVWLFVPYAGDVKGIPSGVDPRRAIALCTETPGCEAFDAAAAVAASAAAALDLSELGALEQRRRGVAARRLPLGLSSRWRIAEAGPAAARERDVLFLGAHSPRREQVLAANAPALAGRRTEIWIGSHCRGLPTPTVGLPRRRLFTTTSIVIDVNHRRPQAIDRVLALETLGAGALPVFEHCVEVDPLCAGLHLEVADGRQLGLVAAGLLDDPGRLDQMASEAHAYAVRELPPQPAVELVVGLAEDVARRAQRRGARRLVDHAVDRRRRPAPVLRSRTSGEPSRAPRPRGPREPRPAPATLRKRATLASIAEHARPSSAPSDGARQVFETAAWEGRPREVAVCVPVHDDGEIAVAALASAVASTGVELEIVVADDASADASLGHVERWLRAHPHVPARLLAGEVNRGVGAVRNAMLAAASAPLTFMLDADNLLFAEGLKTLVAALGGAPEATFAYGILQRVRDGEARGLLSAAPWEPERLRGGNYIDAMALLHRERVLDLGGYTTDRRLYGWEDFDLWCRIAEAGGAGIFVPGFVGRYRERAGSMLSIAELDATDANALLRERYPGLAPSIPAAVGAA